MCSLRTTLWPTSPAICLSSEPASSRSWVAHAVDSRLHGQLAVLQLDRPAVLGDLRADHLLPGAEDGRLGRRLLPAARLHQPVQHRAERLRVARVRARPGVAAQPPPAAGAVAGRARGGRRCAAAACRRASAASEHRPRQLRPARPPPSGLRRHRPRRPGAPIRAVARPPAGRHRPVAAGPRGTRRPRGSAGPPVGSAGAWLSPTRRHRPLADLRSGRRAGPPARPRPPRR